MSAAMSGPHPTAGSKKRYVGAALVLKDIGIAVEKQRRRKTASQPAAKFGSLSGPTRRVKAMTSRATFEVSGVLVELCTAMKNKQGWGAEGVFRISGSTARLRKAKAALEKGERLPEETTAHDCASLIKAFFRELEEGLLYAMRGVILQFGGLQVKSNSWLALACSCHLLPRVNRDTLAYLLEQLSLVDEDATKMPKSNLALMFAVNMFHPDLKCDPDSEPDRIALCSAFETLLNRPYLPQGIPTELQAATAQLDSDVIDKKYKEIALQKRGRTSTRELMLKGSKKVGSAINMALGNMNMGRKKSAPNPTDIKAPMLPPRVPPSNKARKSVLKKTHRMGGSAPNLLDGNSQKRPKRMPSQPPSHAANAKCISSSTAQFRSKGASANEAGKKSSKNHRRTRSSAGRSLSNAEALKAAMHEGQPSRGKAPKHHGNRMVRSKSGSRIGSADSGNVHMKLASSNQKTVFSKYADVEQQCREAKSKTKGINQAHTGLQQATDFSLVSHFPGDFKEESMYKPVNEYPLTGRNENSASSRVKTMFKEASHRTSQRQPLADRQRQRAKARHRGGFTDLGAAVGPSLDSFGQPIEFC